MKKYLFIPMFMFFLLSLFSENNVNESALFEEIEKSVVYIEQSIFLDAKDCENQELFKKLENEYKSEILNTYIGMVSGSGFLITRDGYVGTNAHVVAQKDMKVIKINTYNDLIFNFFSKVSSTVLSDDEYKKVKNDLKKMVDSSKVVYRIKVGNTKFYDATLIKDDEDLDVAILQIKSKDVFKSVLLGDSDFLKVGNPIIAVGYPLPDVISFFISKDFKSTMTTGTVSSIRSDNWGIQHSASINPGNSGGPLINNYGEIVGINVGLIKNANSLYFSIPINKFKTWLNSTKEMNSLVQQNKNDSRSSISRTTEQEIGSNIFVKAPDGYEVYLNGVFKGKSPVYLENIQVEKISIRIESQTEYSEEKFIINQKIKEVFNYTPSLTPYTGNCIISSVPNGADLYVDDRKVGTTPYVYNNIQMGKHSVSLFLDGYSTIQENITVTKNTTSKSSFNFTRGYKINFKYQLPDDCQINVTNGKKSFNFSNENTVFLENGKWTLTIKGKDLEEKKYDIEINNADFNFEEKLTKILTEITFNNLNSNSKVFIDKTEITKEIKNNKIMIEVGEHDLKITTKAYNDINKKIVIEKNKPQNITLTYITKSVDPTGFFYARNAFLITGAASTGGFIPLIVGASFYGYFKSCLDGLNSSSYDYLESKNNYQQMLNTFSYPLFIGVGFVSLSVLSFLLAIPFHVVGKYNEKNFSMKEIDIFIEQKGDLSFGICMKL